MSNTDSVAADQLKAFVERIERLEEEKAALASDVKDVMAEAKSAGFDTKGIRAVLKLRKKSREERQTEAAIVETYAAALGLD